MTLHDSWIPLFPLSKVLFPRMILPLHIFEERYKEMIGECLEEDRPFGVIHDDDQRDLADAVGTLARVQKVLHSYEDGRMDILSVGEERFRIRDVDEESRSFLRARVETFTDVTAPPAARRAIEEMLSLYRSFIARLGLEAEQKKQLEDLVEDVEQERELSYIIGQTIGLDNRHQVDLLSQTTPNGRVGMLTVELRRQDKVHRLARDLFEGEDFDPTLN